MLHRARGQALKKKTWPGWKMGKKDTEGLTCANDIEHIWAAVNSAEVKGLGWEVCIKRNAGKESLP